MGMKINTTENRKAQENIRRNEKLFKSVIDNVSSGVALIDDKGRISVYNPVFLKLFGLSEDSTIKNVNDQNWSDWQVFSENGETLHFDDHPVRKAAITGINVKNQLVGVRLPSGGEIIWMLISAEPVYKENGEIEQIICTYHDISEHKRAEEALKESEERFSKAFQSNPAALSISRLSDGMIVDVNKSFLQLYDYQRDELIGFRSTDLELYNHPDDRKEIVRLLREEGKVNNLEIAAHTKNKKDLIVLISADIIIIKGVEHILFTAIDVTERKKTENALRQSEQKLKYHFENSPLAVVEWDTNYTVKQWSKAAERIFGWKANETIGKNLGDLNMIYEEDFPIVNQTMERLSRGKESMVVGTNRNYTRAGNIIVCNWYNSVLNDDKGQMTSVLSLVDDITERTQAEIDLKNARDKLNIALENGNIGVWEWDLASNELRWDERMKKMFGQESEALNITYSDFESLVNEEDISHIRKAIAEALESNKPLETVYRLQLRNGDSRYISAKALVNRDKDGIPISMTGVCFDVTGMKKGTEQVLLKLNEELLRSNKELERFAYVASHDLQEPLRMVSSFTQLLSKRYKDKLDADGQEYIRYAVDGANRMYGLINGLLAYSRIQTKGKEFSNVDLGTVVDLVKKNLRIQIQERAATITTDDLPVIRADEGQMIQLLQNLVGNAIKFSPGPPKIHISSETDGECTTISVKDEGLGIEPQYFERIFQIFQRLLPKEEYEGTGIGLAICKRIVERHDGKIWVESESGRGTTFFFSIPGEQ